MKILVTGAAGFIGKHVVKALREIRLAPYRGLQNHEVITLDMVGQVDIAADITKPLSPIPDLDAVIHLAAIANPRECDANPSKAFDVNVNGTHQVLKMALASGAKRVVFSSSAHVYDIPPRYFPTDEVHPLRLNNTYTTSKILGEQLCELYWANHGLSYAILRLFNAYGPGQAKGYFIPDMIAKAKAGDIFLKGSGTTKDWVYIDDVVRAFCMAVETPFVGAMNIGTGIETDLGTIAHGIAKRHGKGYGGVRSEKDTRMCADAGRAYRVLGWKPTVNIGDGIDAIFNLAKV